MIGRQNGIVAKLKNLLSQTEVSDDYGGKYVKDSFD